MDRRPGVTNELLCGLVLSAVALCGACSEEGPSKTEELINQLGEMGQATTDELEMAIGVLKTGSRDERVVAAWALGQVGRGEALPGLLDASRADEDKYVRMNAIGAIGILGGPDVETTLVGFIGDEDEEIRSAALRALGDRRYSGSWKALAEVLENADDVAMHPLAADALVTMQVAEAWPGLAAALGSPDKDVRNIAAFGLGKLREPLAVEALSTTATGDAEWEVRANAAQALGMIGDPAARPALEKCKEDDHETVRSTAESALNKLL
ncbi:MAG: HEAT repeat domain-containing protein [bacterium]|nr:HEAT repeat domain-containing protein [bacterium]